MAKNETVMRVGALALMGGAGALFAAQAGVLPGLERVRNRSRHIGPPRSPRAWRPLPPGRRPPRPSPPFCGARSDEDAIPDAFVQARP
jgi:hypothetical protein